MCDDGASQPLSDADIAELAVAHGLFGPPTGSAETELQCECKVPVPIEGGEMSEKLNYYEAVDSFLTCVKYPRREQGDSENSASLLRTARKVKDYIKEYKEIFLSPNDDSSTSDDEEEAEAAAKLSDVNEVKQESDTAFVVPVISEETENILRGSRDLHRQTKELRAFLEELMPEVKQGTHGDVLSCTEMEESSVRQLFSAIKSIAEMREELKKDGELPTVVLSNDTQASLEKCMQILSTCNNGKK